MKKLCITFLSLFVFFSLLSCSVEGDLVLCPVHVAPLDRGSKAISATQMDRVVTSGPDETKVIKYFIKFDSSMDRKYSNLGIGDWLAYEEIEATGLVLSQGAWQFWGRAVATVDMDGNAYGEGNEVVLYETPEEEPSETFINLRDNVIHISLAIAEAPVGSITMSYTVSDTLVATYSYFIKDGDGWTSVASSADGSIAEALPGVYFVQTSVQDKSSGTEVFLDMKFFSVLPGQSVTIEEGSYKSGAQGISTQNGTDTGIKDAIDNATEGEVELIISDSVNELPVKGTGDTETQRTSPLFPIKETVDSITIDLNGKDITLDAPTFKKADVLFHVDTGKTVTLKSSTVSKGQVLNEDANGNSNDKVGSVLEVDGGTIVLDNIYFQGATGNKAENSAIVFGDHTVNKYWNDGGTVVLKNASVDGFSCISNLPANSTGMMGTASNLNKGKNISITIENSTLTTYSKNSKGSREPVYLTSITNSSNAIEIILKGSNTFSSSTAFNFNFTGTTCPVYIYYDNNANKTLAESVTKDGKNKVSAADLNTTKSNIYVKPLSERP